MVTQNDERKAESHLLLLQNIYKLAFSANEVEVEKILTDYIMADGPIGVRIWVLWRRLGSLGCR